MNTSKRENALAAITEVRFRIEKQMSIFQQFVFFIDKGHREFGCTYTYIHLLCISALLLSLCLSWMKSIVSTCTCPFKAECSQNQFWLFVIYQRKLFAWFVHVWQVSLKPSWLQQSLHPFVLHAINLLAIHIWIRIYLYAHIVAFHQFIIYTCIHSRTFTHTVSVQSYTWNNWVPT